MTALQWTPLYADCADNPKFRLVAQRSGQRLSDVHAVWSQMLSPARHAQPGQLRADATELIAIALDLAADLVSAIAAAMQGLTLDGDRLKGWEKRRLAGRGRGEAKISSAASPSPAAARQRRKRERDQAARTAAEVAEPAADRADDEGVTRDVTHERDTGVTRGVTHEAVEGDFRTSDQSVAPDVTPPRLESESEAESEEDRSASLRESRAHTAKASFSEFWLAYPHKVGEHRASEAFEAVFAKARGDPSLLFREVMAGLRAYCETKPPDRQWLNPETFLRDERWRDQPAATARRQSPTENLVAGFAAAAGFFDSSQLFGPATESIDHDSGPIQRPRFRDPVRGSTYAERHAATLAGIRAARLAD